MERNTRCDSITEHTKGSYLRIRIGFVIVIFSFCLPQIANSGWGWLMFHERSFKGKVIDTETKEPIEGAVIVAQYYIRVLGPTHSHSTLTDVQEGLTANNGEFFVPSLTRLIHPLSVGDKTFFMIWKPGYKREEVKDSYFFTKEPGVVENLAVQTERGFEMKPVRLGIVELLRLKTKEERRKELVDPVGEKDDWKKQKQLIKLIREEWEYITGRHAEDLYKIEEN